MDEDSSSAEEEAEIHSDLFAAADHMNPFRE
jgi:hypothetical protein